LAASAIASTWAELMLAGAIFFMSSIMAPEITVTLTPAGHVTFGRDAGVVGVTGEVSGGSVGCGCVVGIVVGVWVLAEVAELFV
jgi:hypothetical protein